MFFLKNHVEKVKIENIKSNEVYAPVEGEVIPLDEVDDAVFSEKILGDGVAGGPGKGERNLFSGERYCFGCVSDKACSGNYDRRRG